MLRRRRMVRTYASDPVPAETVEMLLAAGQRTPSAGFTQGVSFLALITAEDREHFWALTRNRETAWLVGLRTAPLLITVWTSQQAYLNRYAEPDKGWTDRDPARWSAPYWFVDAGMAAMAILLAAVDVSLGACFFGIPPDRVGPVRDAYGVPADQLSVGVVSVGVPASGPSASGSARSRPRRTDAIHRSRW